MFNDKEKKMIRGFFSPPSKTGRLMLKMFLNRMTHYISFLFSNLIPDMTSVDF